MAQDDLSVEQIAAAIDIAKNTANAGLGQVSTDAVARALQFGPPTRSERDGQNPLIFRSVVVDTNQSLPDSAVGRFQRQLPEMLLELSTAWTWSSVRPMQAYQAFRVSVNPPGRPDQLFLYPANDYSNADFPARIDSRSAAEELVRWANLAEQLDNLKRSFNEQQLDAVAEGCFVFLLMAIEQHDVAEIKIRCRQLSRFVQRATSTALIRLLAATLLQSETEVLQLEEAQDLLQLISITLLSVDPQTDGESAYAVTVAIRIWQLQLQSATSRNPPPELQEVMIRGNQVLAAGSSLPPALSTRLTAGIADSILMFDLARQVPAGPLKQAVRSRQGRFPRDRRITANTQTANMEGAKSDGIVVHWNPNPKQHQNAIWCQVLTLDDSGQPTEPHLWFAVSGLQAMGNPTVNHDGSVIAFDGHKPGTAPGSGAHVYVVNRRKQTVVDIGPAVQPSLSPTGRRLTCSRYTPHKGIWLVRTDGTNWNLLDERGWASRFSPDGGTIAYSQPQNRGTAQITRPGLLNGRNTLLRLRPITSENSGVAMMCFEDNRKGWLCAPDSARMNAVLFDHRPPQNSDDMVKILPQRVVDDLHSTGASQFVWLGRDSKGGERKVVYWSGQQGPVSLGSRSATGVTAFRKHNIVVLSKKGNP